MNAAIPGESFRRPGLQRNRPKIHARRTGDSPGPAQTFIQENKNSLQRIIATISHFLISLFLEFSRHNFLSPAQAGVHHQERRIVSSLNVQSLRRRGFVYGAAAPYPTFPGTVKSSVSNFRTSGKGELFMERRLSLRFFVTAISLCASNLKIGVLCG